MDRTTSRESQPAWKLDLGAEVTPDGVRFRVWAPKRRRIEVMLEEAGLGVPLERAGSGYFAGLIKEAKAGCGIAIVSTAATSPRSVFAVSAGGSSRPVADRRSFHPSMA